MDRHAGFLSDLTIEAVDLRGKPTVYMLLTGRFIIYAMGRDDNVSKDFMKQLVVFYKGAAQD